MRRPLILAVLLSACTALVDSPGDPVPATSVPAAEPPATISTTTTAPPEITGPTTTTTVPEPSSLFYETTVTGLPFPVGIESLAGDPRLFVVAKEGRIFVTDPSSDLRVFLDIRDLVRDRGEQGLLGLAFHPDYAQSGRFFVHYSDGSGDTRVVEYRRSAGSDLADPDPVRVILTADQPAGNHNGGQLSFGPDGYLYLGLGDGGGANDQFGQGQRPDTLLGTILRLDVDSGVPYEIPPDNPYVDGGGAPQVWAYGLRNPWRFSFDRGLLYIGDVGQNAFEEIDVAPGDVGGLNYGWPITEGLHCFRPVSGCDVAGLTLPVLEIAHRDSGSCSVTGGVVYRGSAIPSLGGHYLYSDYCAGYLRSFRYQGGEAVDQTDWTDQVGRLEGLSSFGVDSTGEIYVAVRDGRVLRIAPEA
ncbi:MAG: PQQ-dependent sugar dehydrogenase [Acidimicrobiia bacterium]